MPRRFTCDPLEDERRDLGIIAASMADVVRALRHVWLEAAASSTSKTYRSPAEDERTVAPAGRFHNFSYERDLQPTSLEARCARFFAPPPPGWTAAHVLFSSGQAAINGTGSGAAGNL